MKLFSEIQRFGLWVILLMLLPAFIMLSILLYQYMTGEMVGDHPMPDVALLGILLIYIFPITVSVIMARLTVELDERGVHYGWNLPTRELNFIAWEDIRNYEIIRHRFVGAGYKFSKDYGIIYSTSGRQGLQLVTKRGEKILLGTKRPEEMQHALDKLKEIKERGTSPSAA